MDVASLSTSRLGLWADSLANGITRSVITPPLLTRHSPDCRPVDAIFRAVEARRNEIRLLAACTSSQIAGLAASKLSNSPLSGASGKWDAPFELEFARFVTL